MIEYLNKVYFFDTAERFMHEDFKVMCIGGDSTLALEIRKRWPKATIAIVEACAATVAELANDKKCGAQIVHAALGATEGPVNLHCYAHATANSLWPVHKKVVSTPDPLSVEQVEGKTLGTLLDMCGMDTCDLLLMNAEGAELYALRQICEDTGLATSVRQFCCGTHWLHQPLYTRTALAPMLLRLRHTHLIDSHTRYHHGRPNLEYLLVRWLPHGYIMEKTHE